MGQQVSLEKEFYIETPAQPGVTNQLTSLLSETGHCNIKAMWGNNYSGKGHFAFITDNYSKAREVLQSSPFSNFREEDVLVIYTQDQPGSITQITTELSKAKININWLYTTYYNGKPAIVISCDDNNRAFKTMHH